MTADTGKPVNLDGLDYQALQALADEVSAKIAAKRDNELKTLVNGWAQKSQLNGLTIAEVIAEFQHYLPKKAPKVSRSGDGGMGGGGGGAGDGAATHSSDPKPYQFGVTYHNPAGGDTWVGGTKGRQPQWLRALVPDSLALDERTRKFEDLRLKP